LFIPLEYVNVTIGYWRVLFSDFSFISIMNNCLQCFDAVGWAAGRASGL